MSNAIPADEQGHHAHSRNVFALMFGAIGVVFGDIGTSPLYAMKETFAGPHPLALDRPPVLGVLSLVFWAVTIIVSIKYVIFIMRADNRGEGGSLALLALVSRASQGRPGLTALVAALGIFAAALFYGDSMITPAVSLLSAVEGLAVVAPHLEQWVVPATIVILVVLFAIQSHGTAAMGMAFGPIMTAWFGVLAVLGIRNIGLDPGVLKALSPHYAVMFLASEALFAECLGRPGLAEFLQREYRVVPAGPTTLAAMLNSLQMGFRTLAVERRTGEVWRALGMVKTEFTRQDQEEAAGGGGYGGPGGPQVQDYQGQAEQDGGTASRGEPPHRRGARAGMMRAALISASTRPRRTGRSGTRLSS